MLKIKIKIFLSLVFILLITNPVFSEGDVSIIVNADNVEYSLDGKEITAKGNVKIFYKDVRLFCDFAKLNTDTKEATAEGKVRLTEARGIIKAKKLTYNFNTKQGKVLEGEFFSQDYILKAKELEKLSEKEIKVKEARLTTCNFDQPHFHIFSKKTIYYPQDKVRTYSDIVYLGKIPLFYLPHYSHSLKDTFMHIQITPGKSSDWGPYVLTATRYNLTDYINARLYLDYRKRLGLAGGLGANINLKDFGQGDLKFYHTQERPERLPQEQRQEYERYFTRLRYKCQISPRTGITSEFYKIKDDKRKTLGEEHNFLKDYFYREYEKDTQPLSYILLSHNFNYAGLNLLFQKRTNHWYDYVEKLPQLKYTLPQYKLGETPLYLSNVTDLSNLNKKDASNNTDITSLRLDTYNALSLPFKIFFFNLSPFVGVRNTLYDKDNQGSQFPVRTIFYTGLDMTTKFYRIFNIKTNFLGLDINGLRHIISPSVKYSYNHRPTLDSRKIKQIDSLDAIDEDNRIKLELTNKFQTKRNGKSTDLLILRLDTDYIFLSRDPLSKSKTEKEFSELNLDLEFFPYSFLRIDSDAKYNFFYDYFSAVNYDINFSLGKNSFGLGQRYKRKGTNELTTSFSWYINPKWSFSVYERYNFKETSSLKKGLTEQEYRIIRDLHCWTFEINYNIKEYKDHTIWFIFRLKAFPEVGFEFNQSYHKPKAGSSRD